MKLRFLYKVVLIPDDDEGYFPSLLEDLLCDLTVKYQLRRLIKPKVGSLFTYSDSLTAIAVRDMHPHTRIVLIGIGKVSDPQPSAVPDVFLPNKDLVDFWNGCFSKNDGYMTHLNEDVVCVDWFIPLWKME